VSDFLINPFLVSAVAVGVNFNGFGTKYSDPATLPPSTGNGVAFKSTGDNIAVAHRNTPFITVYPWSSGFGTKYANPSELPTNHRICVGFGNNGSKDVIVVGGNVLSSRGGEGYEWSGSGIGNKQQNLNIGDINGLSFSSKTSAKYIVLVTGSSPYIRIYDIQAFTSWAAYSNPATLPASTSNGVSFSNTGDNIAVAHNSSPYITAYPWDNATISFGTKYSDPATLPPNTGRGVTFSPDDSTIAVAHSTTPYVSVYPWSNGFGTKYSDPSTLPTNIGRGISFSSSGNSVAVAHSTTPYVSVYPWSNGFGTKYADPATLPSGQGNGVAFNSLTGAIAIAHSTTPYISTYPST
jgi:hypothetical protein